MLREVEPVTLGHTAGHTAWSHSRRTSYCPWACGSVNSHLHTWLLFPRLFLFYFTEKYSRTAVLFLGASWELVCSPPAPAPGSGLRRGLLRDWTGGQMDAQASSPQRPPGFCPFRSYSDTEQSPLGWPEGFWSGVARL